MNYKTAEEKLLADYEALEAKCEALEEQLGSKRSPEEDAAAYRIDRPVELVSANVETYWYDSDETGVSKMTSEELREACATRDGLVRIAELRGRYGCGKTAYISRRIWPYQIKALGVTFAVDFTDYDNKVTMSEATIYDPTDLDTDHWFPVECKADLYELALEELKTALLKRAEKLEAEAAKEGNDAN